jgi:hypothetical protein
MGFIWESLERSKCYVSGPKTGVQRITDKLVLGELWGHSEGTLYDCPSQVFCGKEEAEWQGLEELSWAHLCN